ncbi:MAG: hypothetical protein ACRERV_02340 [Methylococcales bacterium]
MDEKKYQISTYEETPESFRPTQEELDKWRASDEELQLFISTNEAHRLEVEELTQKIIVLGSGLGWCIFIAGVLWALHLKMEALGTIAFWFVYAFPSFFMRLLGSAIIFVLLVISLHYIGSLIEFEIKPMVEWTTLFVLLFISVGAMFPSIFNKNDTILFTEPNNIQFPEYEPKHHLVYAWRFSISVLAIYAMVWLNHIITQPD